MGLIWKTSKRELMLDSPVVMGILNVTPDSFSDGGKFHTIDRAVDQAAKLIDEGVDIIDVGGESTRPGSLPVSADEEISRTIPVIMAISTRFDTPISIDTTKASVAIEAIEAGAEIINDISGLRFDEKIAQVAAESGSGLVLMHSRGEFGSMHNQEPVADIFADVRSGFQCAIDLALSAGVQIDHIALDIGLGFGKTFEQNLALIAKLDSIVSEFQGFPMLVGASRKSFIGRLLEGVDPDQRLGGSIAAATIAVLKGASILRVHDVAETVKAVRVAHAIRSEI